MTNVEKTANPNFKPNNIQFPIDYYSDPTQMSSHNCREMHFYYNRFGISNGKALTTGCSLFFTNKVIQEDNFKDEMIELTKIHDAIIGNIAIILASNDSIAKLKFKAGDYSIERKYDGSTKTHDLYRYLILRYNYLGIPNEVFFFDPMYSSIFTGLSRICFWILMDGLAEKIFSVVPLENFVRALNTKNKDLATENIFKIWPTFISLRSLFLAKDSYRVEHIDKENDLFTYSVLRDICNLGFAMKEETIEDIKVRWSKSRIKTTMSKTSYMLFHDWKALDYKPVWKTGVNSPQS